MWCLSGCPLGTLNCLTVKSHHQDSLQNISNMLTSHSVCLTPESSCICPTVVFSWHQHHGEMGLSLYLSSFFSGWGISCVPFPPLEVTWSKLLIVLVCRLVHGQISLWFCFSVQGKSTSQCFLQQTEALWLYSGLGKLTEVIQTLVSLLPRSFLFLFSPFSHGGDPSHHGWREPPPMYTCFVVIVVYSLKCWVCLF